MDDVVRFSKALSDPLSVRILACLQDEGDLCICEIQEAFGVTRPVAERGLLKLREVGLITMSSRGHWRAYRLNDQDRKFVSEFLAHFANSVQWDGRLKAAKERLAVAIDQRVDGWCRPSGL